MQAPAELAISGRRLAPITLLPVGASWRWIGYLPPTGGDLPGAPRSAEGLYDYLLGEAGVFSPLERPFLNTLFRPEPGQGFLIRRMQEGEIVFGP